MKTSDVMFPLPKVVEMLRRMVDSLACTAPEAYEDKLLSHALMFVEAINLEKTNSVTAGASEMNEMWTRNMYPVVAAAFALTEQKCHCDPCWTDRQMHDPRGCLWAEATDLREALEKAGSLPVPT